MRLAPYSSDRSRRRLNPAVTLAVIAAFLVLCLPLRGAAPAAAMGEGEGERILSFHSHILVNPDASLTVTETIRVRSTGGEIKHGIYRDFPTSYRKWWVGPRRVVGFEVLEVRRDGQAEGFHFEGLANGRRVYLGKQEVLLPPGEYTYTLTYRTDRQLHFAPGFDELYWNVTGNDWTFPIDEATADVELPQGGGDRALRLDGFTGVSGSREKALIISRDAAGSPVFRATRPLEPGEGLTIVVTWPQGLVAEPTAAERQALFFRDNRGTVLGLAGLLVLTAYYLLLWARFGRDPRPGVIVPLFAPPRDLSPAAVRYISRMSSDDRTVAAALVGMAVKKFLVIRETDGVFTLERGEGAAADLSSDEKALGNLLFAKGGSLVLQKANHETIKSGVSALRRSLTGAYEKVYFLTNRGHFLTGAAISAALMLVAAALEAQERIPVAAFIGVWLSIWSLGVTLLLAQVVSSWKAFIRERGAHRFLHLGGALFITAFSAPFVAGEIFGLGVLTYATSLAVILILALAVIINAVFYQLLKAPTLAGRKILDGIEGFRLYLSATAADQLSRMNPEALTPRLFEKFLPYAMALDVEQAWTARFAGVLGDAAAGGEYRPSWYAGTSLATLGAAGFASSFGDSLGGAVSSSSMAAGSGSGSGGGGSSGGGGGGGGGGGW